MERNYPQSVMALAMKREKGDRDLDPAPTPRPGSLGQTSQQGQGDMGAWQDSAQSQSPSEETQVTIAQ